jgi:hypothetical protein
MKVYFKELFSPLQKKLYEAVNNMIKYDRDCVAIARYKIKHILRIFEEVDMKIPDLVKEGDNLYWVGQPVLGVLSDWFNNYFIKFVNFINYLD